MAESVPEDVLEKLKAELFAGRKISAIKMYREATGVGLAEAKSAVEQLEGALRDGSPDQFTRPAAGRGCLIVAVILVLIVVAVFWLVKRQPRRHALAHPVYFARTW